jgi:TolB-like protein/DNA-binding SARP family transcriptional activator
MADNRSAGFELELRLAGRLRLLRRDGVDVTPNGRKAQGLLALLGVAPEFHRPRAWLQDKLWSTQPSDLGANSLRQELARLRRLLGDNKDCLLSEHGGLALDPRKVRVRLDPEPGDWELTGEPPEFVDGLDIADPEFEEWVRDQRLAFADRYEQLSPALAEIRPAERPPEPQGALPPSIAILPIEVIGDKEAGSVLATCLALDIISHLTRFRRLDVIAYATTSTFVGTGKTASEIGHRLGARYITQGTLLISGLRMRLKFDLIEAESHRVLWSDTINAACADMLDVEAEMATAVAAGVMVEIDQLERARVRARNPGSLAAYELCIRGLDEILRVDPNGCLTAISYFNQAVDQEQGYARALSGISRAHGFQWKYRWIPDRAQALDQAEAFALRAVDADINDASANAGLGWVALYRREHDRALEAYRRAMQLNPSDADIIAEYADALKHDGSAAESIPLFERAIRLNPYASDHYLKDLADAYFKCEDYETAIRTIRRMRRPHLSSRILAASYALSGDLDSARRTAATLRRAYPDFKAEVWLSSVPDRHVGETERFLEGMKRAGL